MSTLEKFRAMGLSEAVLEKLEKKGFKEPTSIQEKAIPAILNSTDDIVALARTGTGKTAAFGLPLVEMLDPEARHVQAIILVPTRELALQVAEEITSFTPSRKLQVAAFYGGDPITKQISRLREGVHIVAGTPGRVQDLINRKALKLGNISFLVLDEADEMLNMGFIDDIEKIMSFTGENKRTVLFSATMPSRILKVASSYMKKHTVIKADEGPQNVSRTEHSYFPINQKGKLNLLCRLMEMEPEFYGLVFCRTKKDVDELAIQLNDKGYLAEGIHGDLSQSHRERILDSLRRKKTRILVATDVAARGIDINDLTHVINYSIPQDSETYVHRVGRTGRAGKTGKAVTFASPSEEKRIRYIMKDTGFEIARGNVPSVQEIIDFKKDMICNKIAKLLGGDIPQNERALAAKMLTGCDPLELVATLIHHSFGSDLQAESYGKIQEKQASEIKAGGRTRNVDTDAANLRLFVSHGKKDGMNSRKLVTLVEEKARVKRSRINGVTVMEEFSFLTVPREDSGKVLLAFKRRKGGSLPVIERAK